MQIWHLHEVQDRSSGVGPEGQRELRPSFASPGVCMCLTVMSSCGVNKFWIMYQGWERSPPFKPGLLEPALVSALCAYAGYISSRHLVPTTNKMERAYASFAPTPSIAQGARDDFLKQSRKTRLQFCNRLQQASLHELSIYLSANRSTSR